MSLITYFCLPTHLFSFINFKLYEVYAVWYNDRYNNFGGLILSGFYVTGAGKVGGG